MTQTSALGVGSRLGRLESISQRAAAHRSSIIATTPHSRSSASSPAARRDMAPPSSTYITPYPVIYLPTDALSLHTGSRPFRRAGTLLAAFHSFLYRLLSDISPHIAPVSFLDPLTIFSATTIHSSSYYHHLLLLHVFFPLHSAKYNLLHSFPFSVSPSPSTTTTRPPPFLWVLYSALRICCPPPTHGRRGRPEGCGLGCCARAGRACAEE
ncbi:hypothetical protein FB451DRAFT_437718 [Mycena latifolia]|nr:hypothetical protein FB451DRAFT_437718 [Mycena latifolia]